MRLYLFLLVLVLTSISSIAQSRSAGLTMTDNEYRSSSNKYYWKNRMPDAAYWQQDVQYKIRAVMHEEDHHIEATEELTYWNNSPDTLTYVYFHLYQNAFVNGSYLRQLEKMNKVNARMGKNEAAGLGTTTENIKTDGTPARSELDNTILKVYLAKPLYPGGKVVISMNFNTWYDKGDTRRRMKMYNAWGFMHYNGCQWFPKVCVYDRMHGWDTYQHLNKEFYGDYGLYDVTLDFPSNYIVEATGVLQNRDEVLPKDLRDKLDIKNFAAKKWDEAPSEITPYEKGKRKQWRFVGSNVHDFAFTADPSYRIGTAYWNGVECVALVQEPHAAGWQNAPDYITKIIKTFSEDIGMYCYPKIVAADAADGMEYPMLTLDGGSDPGYRGLLVHEIGHNWFYGQVGSNETYRAALDEGFTQFLTAWGLNRIDGENMVEGKPKSKYRRMFAEPTRAIDLRVLNRYTYEALHGMENTLNTHSDDFNNALNHGGGYGQVYYKTATMLYNLQYVLGDSLFLAAIQHYFDQWKMAHPYFEDFRASVINFTHVDLSWFFDEWFETAKTLDYGICGIKKIKGADSFAIKFYRGSEMQMPLDFTVTAKDGSKHDFYIPNTWFEKQSAATKLPKWTGWGSFNRHYTARVQVPSGVRSVRIDTSYRMADIDMVDNYKRKGLTLNPRDIKVKFDGGTAAPMDRRHYRLYVRPDLWWNPIDGIKAGVHFEGDYLGILNKVDATVWLNTHVLQQPTYQTLATEGLYAYFQPVHYTLNYQSPITRYMPKLQMQVNSRFLDGLWYHRGGFNWHMNDKNMIQVYAQSMWQYNSDFFYRSPFSSYNQFPYLVYSGEWSSDRNSTNTSLNFSWGHSYNYMRGAGRYIFSFRAPFLNNKNGGFDYSYAQLESVNSNYLGKLEIRTRVFGRYGLGNNIPYESALFMAGANPEELMENKYTRSRGIVPDDWQGISQYDVNHFHQGGGLNLRGYSGYFAPDTRNGVQYVGYKGRSGASANLEIGFENYMPWRPRFFRWLHANLYAFGDAGVIELGEMKPISFGKSVFIPTNYWSDLRVDAGLGVAFTIKKWGVFDKAKPLTIRFDMPAFLNRPPYSNNQYATFRYVIGINRAF